MPFDVKSVASIIMEARSHEAELPWIEFKTNWDNPQDIGEYISALSNMAALFNQPHGFLIWGIDDKTHEIVGTSFDPQKAKRGGQDLGLWIATQLDSVYMRSSQNSQPNSDTPDVNSRKER